MNTQSAPNLVITAATAAVGLLSLTEGSAAAQPHGGSRELRLTSGYVVGSTAGIGIQPGVSVLSEKGPSATYVNIGGSFGTFISEGMEVGASLHYIKLSQGGFGTGGPLIEPFVKFYR